MQDPRHHSRPCGHNAQVAVGRPSQHDTTDNGLEAMRSLGAQQKGTRDPVGHALSVSVSRMIMQGSGIIV
jgi:hypothetical protein